MGTTSQLFSYDQAALCSLLPFNIPPQMSSSASGGLAVYSLRGSDFGKNDYSPHTRPLPSAAEATRWVSDTASVGRFAVGAFGTRPVVVTTGREHVSTFLAASYNTPTLSRTSNRTAWNRSIGEWRMTNGKTLLYNFSSNCSSARLPNCSAGYIFINSSSNASFPTVNGTSCLNRTLCMAGRTACSRLLVYCPYSGLQNYTIPLVG